MSVPGPWPDRKPIMGLIVAVVVWAAAALFLISWLLRPAQSMSWAFALLQLGLGSLAWLHWRQAVHRWQQRMGADD